MNLAALTAADVITEPPATSLEELLEWPRRPKWNPSCTLLTRSAGDELVGAGATEQDYGELFKAIDQGFCTIEVLFDHGIPVDYLFLDVNPAFERQTGLRDAVGRRIRELIPALESHWFRIYGDVARTGVPLRFVQEAAALGRWYEVFALRVGAPELRRVAVLFNDITVRRRTEQALHASETRYRALAHATTTALYRFNSTGTELVEVYGGDVSPHSTTTAPSTSWMEDYVHPDDRERVRRAWLDGIASGAMFEIEHRALLAQGTWGWVHSRTVPVRDNAGQIAEWIGSAIDITSQKKVEEVLRQREAEHDAARREAEIANRAKDEFLAMLGHELRNPLAPMLTALELLRLRGTHSREQDVLARQVKHLSRMVDDLLDVSRITRGKIELKRRPVELAQIVLRAMELTGPMLEQRHAYVDVRVPSHGAGIDADRDRMAQVLANLLTNAAKYSESGSRITIAGERLGSVVRISVRDEGIGLPREMLDSVFEPFVQQPQSLERSGGGLGLGLAIVRSIVTAHGGTVRAESAGLNRGSEFIIELPAVEAVAEEQAPPPVRTRAGGAQRRILVVDDNKDAVTMLRSSLEHLGYIVDVAYDGPSALARAEVFRPSTVLLDIGLPVMDGYEVARRLKARHTSDPPVRLLALTGYGQDSDRQRSHDAGFEHHLIKPIDLDRLHQLIEDAPREPGRIDERPAH